MKEPQKVIQIRISGQKAIDFLETMRVLGGYQSIAEMFVQEVKNDFGVLED